MQKVVFTLDDLISGIPYALKHGALASDEGWDGTIDNENVLAMFHALRSLNAPAKLVGVQEFVPEGEVDIKPHRAAHSGECNKFYVQLGDFLFSGNGKLVPPQILDLVVGADEFDLYSASRNYRTLNRERVLVMAEQFKETLLVSLAESSPFSGRLSFAKYQQLDQQMPFHRWKRVETESMLQAVMEMQAEEETASEGGISA